MASGPAGSGAVPDLSVIVPVGHFFDDLAEIHRMFLTPCLDRGWSVEFLFLVHGEHPGLERTLASLEAREGVRVIRVARTFDESAALSEGFRRAGGALVATLPAYHSVEPTALPDLVDAVRAGADCAVAVRAGRRDPSFNRLQSALFHRVASWAAGRRLRDITNGARVMRREVAQETVLYGAQHRYLPILLLARGCQVTEVEVPQSRRERQLRVFGPATYLNRFVDLAAVFFLLRFTQRPLRFFGAGGALFAGAGVLFCLWLSWERLVVGVPLADRPALLLGLLLIVLGVQMASIGLLGELVVHLHARRAMPPLAQEAGEPPAAETMAAGEVRPDNARSPGARP